MTFGSADWFTVAILLLAVGATLYDRFQEDPDKLEQLKEQHTTGDIPLAEYERRVELLIDDDAQRICEIVEEVNDIGPETAKAIARRFESIQAVENADREELESISGVGEDRARAIIEYLGE